MAKTFLKLTRPAMRKLGPGEKASEHGITFERNNSGDGVFTVNIMVDGQRIHRVVGKESDGCTRSQAEDYIEKIRSDAKNQRLALPKGRKIAPTFRAAATKYLENLQAEGGKDLRMKRQRLDHHLVPFFGELPLNKICAFDIERYKSERLKQAVSIRPRGKEICRPPEKVAITKPATVNRELAVLSHLFSKSVEWGWIDRRPALIRRLSEGRGRIIYLTVDQIHRLLECAQADNSAQIYPFMVIGLETSMRLSEILSIRREDIDLERRVIFIRKAKAGAREQPITEHLTSFLKAYVGAMQPGNPWLFPSPGAKSGHTMDIRKPFRRVVLAAGMDPDVIVRHTLRHTAITHLVQAGVDLPTVKRISGHKTLAMVERYSHANGQHISAAMDVLQTRLRIGTS